jgi:hypothetical protein
METDNITVTFTFWNSTYTQKIGTVSDTALATFNYANGTDNLCWSNSTAGGTALYSSSLTGTCGAPGGGETSTGIEALEVDLAGSYYVVDLHDWDDWDETPQVNFKWVAAPVPEPATWTMFLLGFGGIGFMLRSSRRKGVVATA